MADMKCHDYRYLLPYGLRAASSACPILGEAHMQTLIMLPAAVPAHEANNKGEGARRRAVSPTPGRCLLR